MFKQFKHGVALFFFAVTVLTLSPGVAVSQTTNGSIAVQVMDPTKALLPGTHLVLTDSETNVPREGTTLSSGTFTFSGLTPASYHLIVTHVGFDTVNYDSILVQAGVATPVNVTMKVGSDIQKVEVSAVSVPVIETSSNTLSTSIDIEEVNNLPVANRGLTGLQALSPGFASTTGNGTGTFDGTPQAAYQANLDGINATSSRFKDGSGSGASLTMRVENIQEFTVQSGELPPSQGGGQSAAQTLFVTNRGTNKYHGRVFENHQDESLNAFPWSYGFQNPRLPKPHLVINDFGGAIGGPILRNKMFFFVNFSARLSPSINTVASVLPTDAVLQGNYTYCTTATVPAGAPCATNTVNVLQYAAANSLDGNLNGGIAFQQALNKPSYQFGTFTQTTTQFNTRTLNFQVPTLLTQFYPAIRVDYAVSPKLNVSLSTNFSRTVNKGAYDDPLPGSYFQTKTTGNFTRTFVTSIGADYNISPTILDQFRVGGLYTYTIFSPEAAGFDVGSQGATNYNFGGINTSGNFSITPQGSYYPYLQANNDLSWQKGSHTIKLGGNIWHQQDHYYNVPSGYIDIGLGLNSLDPAYNTIRNLIPTSGTNLPSNLSGAQGDITALYGFLNGRVTSASGQYAVNRATGKYGIGTYGLDEASIGGGIYAQDSWRAFSGFTINYGLRFDFLSDIHDVKNGYTGPSASDLFGSSGFLNIFQPGVNTGSANPLYTTSGHKYNANLFLPQPQIGFAWNPNKPDGWMGKLFGAGKTVFRASYTLKNYTEGGQNFWQAASNGGYNFFNSVSLNASNSVGVNFPQNFAYGTVHLGTPTSCTNPVMNCVNVSTENAAATGGLPTLFQSPSTYLSTIPQSSLFFKSAGTPAAIDPNIKQPYLQSYTFGIQRQLSNSSAFEVRYVGNRSIHDWISYNYNEINSLNNGFMQDFLNAQKNLAANTIAGHPNDFSDRGSGFPMPILGAAFAGTTNFTNGSYVTFLNNGSMGGLAAAVANNQAFYCNVVGQGFGPCGAVGLGPLTSSFPSNLFQANAYLESRATNFLSSKGSSNYNGLQVEFRQKVKYGLDLNVNYTIAKTLGNSSNQASGSTASVASVITLHNLHYNYQPISYDIRNALKLSGTYSLPFGKNRAFFSNGKMMNYLVGGFTVGAITIYQSGAPIALTGGLSSTINPASDGGVSFLQGSAHDIQKSVGVTRSKPGNSFVNIIGSQYQQTDGRANAATIAPNKTPGVEGFLPFIYGPKWNNFDLSVTKDLPIFEAVHMDVQGIFLNAFNHPEFIGGTFSTQSTTFGTTSSLAQAARRIELRANVTF